MTRVRSSKSQRYLFSHCSSYIFLFFHIFLMTLLCFSFKEAFQMPFTTISRKILCEDLLPLFPLPSLPNASSMTRIPTSISYYEVLTTEWSLLLIFNILFRFLFEFDVSVFKFYKSIVYILSVGFLQRFFLTLHRSTSSYWLHIFSSTWRVLLRY